MKDKPRRQQCTYCGGWVEELHDGLCEECYAQLCKENNWYLRKEATITETHHRCGWEYGQ